MSRAHAVLLAVVVLVAIGGATGWIRLETAGGIGVTVGTPGYYCTLGTYGAGCWNALGVK